MTLAESPILSARDEAMFIPSLVRVLEVREVTAREKFFRVELERPLGHRPGQFVMVSAFGVGEAPISIACGPRDDCLLEMLIRKAGDDIGVRGPFGSGFLLDDLLGKDLLLVAGGLGLAPLRSLIQAVIDRHEEFGTITVVSGSRTPAEELFRDESREWGRVPNVRVIRLVNEPAHMPWDGDVGLVTAPLAELPLDVPKTLAVLCGPPVMYKFVIMELVARGLGYGQIYLDLERRMRCGVGRCGHCQIQHLYCCCEGPVFRYSEIASLREALG